MELPIVTRKQWGAKPPKMFVSRTSRLHHVISGIVGKKNCYNFEECKNELQILQRFHMLAAPDIRPNFLIGGDLRIYEGRGWATQPGLSHDYKHICKRSLYIGFVGNFGQDTPEGPRIPWEMESLANNLVFFGIENGIVKTDAIIIKLY